MRHILFVPRSGWNFHRVQSGTERIIPHRQTIPMSISQEIIACESYRFYI